MPSAVIIRRAIVSLFLAIGLTGQAARAQVPDRADLARAYLDFERAYFAAPRTDHDEILRANRAIDTAAVAMFGNQSASAWATLRAEAARLELGHEPGPARAAAAGVRFTPRPGVAYSLDQPPPPIALVFERLVDDAVANPTEFGVTITDARGTVFPVGKFALPALAGATEEIGFYRPDLARDPHGKYFWTGRAVVHLDLGPEGKVLVGWIQSTDESFGIRRDRVLEALDALQETVRESPVASICRDRCALLTDTPGSERSTDFLFDLDNLAKAVEGESAAIARGENPYARRPGDLWRTFPVGGVGVPVRVFAPDTVADADAPALPLLIVLHGAGGDENMFFEGYGNGLVKHLAAERNILVASPLNSPFSGTPEVFDALVGALAADYPIDPARIYVLGHSMGAGAATAWSRLRSDRVAAACSMAGIATYGKGGPGAQALAPTLVIVPEIDGLIPPQRLIRTAREAAESGLPVTLRVVPDYGHALVVGRMLPEAVDWLLEHRLPSR